MWHKLKVFIKPILGTFLIGGLAAFLTRHDQAVYETLVKPKWSPPGAVFPFVWGVLYLLMAIGLGLVKQSGKPGIRDANTIYWTQLVLNGIWPLLFFTAMQFFFSFLWLVLLFFMVIAMILAFAKCSEKAALLQIPYLLWVAFAGYLNLMIALKN